MDFSKFKVSDWLVIGGAIGMLAFGFLRWSSGPPDYDPYVNVFDFVWTGFVPWELLIGAAAITVMWRLGVIQSTRTPWSLVILVMTAVAAVLLLVRLAFNPGAPEGYSVGIGMILSFVAGLVAAGGGVLGYLESTGKVSLSSNQQQPQQQYPQYAPQGFYPQNQPGQPQYPQQPGQPQYPQQQAPQPQYPQQQAPQPQYPQPGAHPSPTPPHPGSTPPPPPSA